MYFSKYYCNHIFYWKMGIFIIINCTKSYSWNIVSKKINIIVKLIAILLRLQSKTPMYINPLVSLSYYYYSFMVLGGTPMDSKSPRFVKEISCWQNHIIDQDWRTICAHSWSRCIRFRGGSVNIWYVMLRYDWFIFILETMVELKTLQACKLDDSISLPLYLWRRKSISIFLLIVQVYNLSWVIFIFSGIIHLYILYVKVINLLHANFLFLLCFFFLCLVL